MNTEKKLTRIRLERRLQSAWCLCLGGILLFSFSAFGQPTTAQRATQTEVNAGANNTKFVTPLTLKNKPGGGGTDTNAIANLNGKGTNTTLRFPTLLSVSNIQPVNASAATVIASNIGVMPIAAGGSGDFADLAATAPKFNHQLSIAANGVIGVGNSTSTGDWNATDKGLEWPFDMTFGDQNGNGAAHTFGKNGAFDFWANASAYNQTNDTGRNDAQSDDNVLSIGNANSRKYGAIAYWRKGSTNLTTGWQNSGGLGIGNIHAAAPYQFFFWEMNNASDALGGLSIQSTVVSGAPSWTYLVTNAITGAVTTNTSSSHYYLIADNSGRLVVPYNRTGANDPFGRSKYFLKLDPLKDPNPSDPNVLFSNAAVKIFPGGSLETPGMLDSSPAGSVASVLIGSTAGTRNSAHIASDHFFSIEAAGWPCTPQYSLFGGGGLYGATDLIGLGFCNGTITTNISISRTATDANYGGVGMVSSLRINPTGINYAPAGKVLQADGDSVLGGNVSISGRVTSYNGDTTWTTAQGVPTILNLNQPSFSGASSGTNTLYTPVSNGVFRVSVYMQVTTAGTSGTLSSTVYWSDQGQAQSFSPAAQIANLGVKGFSQGSVFINATNGVPIKIGYTTGAVVGSPSCRIDTCIERIQ